jgi:exopolyphosphatase/guanosine-5'-triphosphate,3'-diphosphate pyrophosphatase
MMNTSNLKKKDDLFAALDLGSNSFHLIVARMEGSVIHPVQRVKERIKLRAGLDENQQLNNESILRAVDYLEKVGDMLKEIAPARVRVVGTHTIREAKNRNAFLLLAERALGFPIEIISGREEARLIFQGVVRSESLKGTTLVVDIGGGSTEIAVGDGNIPKLRESRSLGCIGYSERFFSKEISQDMFKKAHIAALQKLELCSYRFKKFELSQAIATSGTAKALIKAVGLVSDNKEGLLLTDLLALRDLLCQKSGMSKLSWVGIDEKRAKILPGGLAIMIAIMESLNIKLLTYCDFALREGILHEMNQQSDKNNTRLITRQEVQTCYQVDRKHALHVAETCDLIFQQVAQEWAITAPKYRDLLLEAAHLHEVGLQISTSDFQRHSCYILANSDLSGYNKDEQELLSVLVNHFRKKFKAENLPSLRIINNKMLVRLIRLLRLAVILNSSRQPLLLDLVKLKAISDTLELTIDKQFFLEQELNVADLEKESELMTKLGMELLVYSN